MSHSNRFKNRNYQQPGQTSHALAAEVADASLPVPTEVDEHARELFDNLTGRFGNGFEPPQIAKFAYDLAEAFAAEGARRRSPPDKQE